MEKATFVMNCWQSIRCWINRNNFSFVVFFVASVAGLAIFFLSHMISSKVESNAVADFAGEGLSIINETSRRVEHLFDDIGHDLRQLSRLKEIRSPDNIQNSEIFEVTYKGLMDQISCLRRLDSEGDLVFGYRGDCEPIEKAPSEREWDYFQEALSEKKLVVSDLFTDSAGQRRIRIAYPIIRQKGSEGEEFDGVVTAGVKIDDINALMVSPFSTTEQEWISIVWYDTKGRVISFPDHPHIDGKNGFNGKTPCNDCHAFSAEFLGTGRIGQGWEIVHNFDGRKMVILHSPMKLANQVWMVGLYADYDHVVREAVEIEGYANLVAALSVFIILLGSFISFSLLRARRESQKKEKEIKHERELLRKVEESEEKYRDLFEGVRSGVYISTHEGQFIEVNDAMVKMLGYDSKEELLGIDIRTDLYADPHDRTKFMEEVEGEEVIKDFESRLLKKDGSHIICLETSYGRRDESGRIIEYMGVLLDISRRKRIEAQLEESRKRLRELFDGASMAIFVEDMEGNILDVNRKAIELFGYEREEFLNMNAIDVFTPQDAGNVDRFREALKEEGSFTHETKNRLKDGTLIDVEVNCQTIAVGDETLVQVFVRDMSEVKRKESEIRGKNEELNTLNEVSKVISRSLVLDEILNLSLEKMLEVTVFDAGAIYLYDERTQTLNLEAVLGLPTEINEMIDSIPMGETLTGEIARDKKMILLDSLSEDSRSLTAKVGIEFNSYVGLPILYGERLMGVVNLASYTRLSREEFKVDLLKGVTELIGIAVSNAHLYGSTQRNAKEMKVLYESGKSFMALTDKDQLASMVVEVASSVLGYNACTLFGLDEESGELSILNTSCLNKEKLGKENIKEYLDGVVGWVTANKALCYLPDVKKDPRYQPGCLRRGSELAMPLLVGEKILGVIDFEREEINGFSPEGIRYLSLFANQVAWAMDNVKLFEEIKKANDDLNRISELKTQFVSLVSHELRTPMTAIKGSLDIIHSGAAGPIHEKQKMFISMARRNIDRLSDLINNILDLSRIEAGKIEFDFNEIDIQNPLNNVMLTLAGTADDMKVALESQLPSDIPTLYADEAKVEQVLTNLIANALKHTPSGGKVTVMACKAGGSDMNRIAIDEDKPAKFDRFVKVSVLDTGSGIPKDQLETIFDRYIQLRGKKGERGTGLGLTICRYLVEGHGGAIWAERSSERGSVLSFLLPVFQRGGGTYDIDREFQVEDRGGSKA